ncbi:MAG: histidine kinase dimerization/phospho-acceptor domain-containing protein [Terriglobia bacterium]
METTSDCQPALKLLGLLAHQMSQPLTVLLGEVELALRFQHSEVELKGTLERCFRDLERAGRLVSDFRILGEMSNATISLVPLAELIGGIVEAHRSEAAVKGLKIDWRASENASIETDPEVLRRVLSMVLGKAVRASPPGGTLEAGLDQRLGNAQFKLSYTEAGRSSDGSERRARPAPSRVPVADDAEWALAESMIQLLGGAIEVYRGAGSQVRLSMALGLSREISATATP